MLVYLDSEIGNIISSVVKPKGYSIVTRYTGHGINQLVRPIVRIFIASCVISG